MPVKKKRYPATRKFALRTDASIKTGQKKIAEVFGLPVPCIRLVKPNGKRIRSDATVFALLQAWDYLDSGK